MAYQGPTQAQCNYVFANDGTVSDINWLLSIDGSALVVPSDENTGPKLFNWANGLQLAQQQLDLAQAVQHWINAHSG